MADVVDRERETPTLEEAYRKHYKQVWRTCYKMLRSEDAADDAAQDVFVHISTRLDKFNGEAKFSTWLTRVTINLTLMKLRGKAKRQRAVLSLDEMEEGLQEAGQEAFQNAIAVHDTNLEAVVARTTLQNAIAHMPAGYRLILDLRHIQGFSIEEVADMLDTTIGTIKASANKGMCWLAREMGVVYTEPRQPEVIATRQLDTLLEDFAKYL